MDVFLGEWANLLIRWMHLVVGIGWIGTSFYFMALDYSLNKLGQKQGVLGTAWQVHGGGFYFVEKYTVAPPQLPETLHWFKWEAYLTWVSGFGLLIVQYYIHARSYLIDPSVLPLTPWQAIGISLGSILAGWAIYEGLCRSPIGQNTTILAICFFALIMGAAVFYTHVFSARGAFLHVGALTGSIMATNVFAVIIPNQKKMIAQMIQGKTPDPYYGMVGKQRSTHNNYLTLPVLVMMVSPHYPFLSAHPHAWLVVALILIAGASIRHYLNRVDAGDDWKNYGWTAPVAVGALMIAIFVTAPRSSGGGAAVSDAEVLAVTQKHCVMCHAAKPTHEGFTEAPKNITLDNIASLRQYAAQIYVQAVQTNAMPLGNETGMTQEERDALGRWVNAQK
ncbi:cysteine desulfurase [Pseudolabrys taiwanensis]|uniref:Cysteine desulfurase n=1 Tax=Pseudolabrys taiwanensis TaxID=331696 RepID=A0A345ZSW1_9HYPH|nr:urate hydroxylase PuuD [Pseudolabrys taiwanensis]AXK80008.1 cysteine desulfurase [Pseudolabrys taiwanensis]